MDDARKAKRRERIRMIMAVVLMVLAVIGIVRASSGGDPVLGVFAVLWLFLASGTLGDVVLRRRRQNAASAPDATPQDDPSQP